MATNPTKPKPVPVRIPPDLIARLDDVRSNHAFKHSSREAFVRYLLDKALSVEERNAGKR